MKPLIVLLFMLGGCASVNYIDVTMEIPEGKCRVTEVSPSIRSTVVYAMCKKDNIIYNVNLVPAMSKAGVITSMVRVGAVIGAGAIVGSGLSGIDTATSIAIPGLP